MINKFKFDYFYKSVYEIEYDLLKKRGIKALFFDIDNTLVTYDTKIADEKIKKLFEKLQNSGFSIYLLSNNSLERARVFGDDAGVLYKGRALKPFLFYVKRAMKKLGVKSTETALVGDQLFTDVWCANRAKITSVLVKPISEKEESFVSFKRKFEKKLLEKFDKERQK